MSRKQEYWAAWAQHLITKKVFLYKISKIGVGVYVSE